VTSASKAQDIASQLASQIDANKDGQISTGEFGSFILNLLESKASGSTGNRATATLTSALNAAPSDGGGGKTDMSNIWRSSALGYTPAFLGFDSARTGAPGTFSNAAGSLKYDAYNVLKNYDPRDPNAAKMAFAELNALHPGQYELDGQDNIMLTGTADGYIGARPINRDNDWNDRSQPWGWQWMSYNAAHPGPSGEIT